MEWSTLEQLRAWNTPTRQASRARARCLLDEKYPGQYVAYTDDWNGEELVRTVVAASADLAEFQQLLAALDPDTRRRMTMTSVPPADLIATPSVDLP
jgi:hypothetical protein